MKICNRLINSNQSLVWLILIHMYNQNAHHSTSIISFQRFIKNNVPSEIDKFMPPAIFTFN